MANFKLSVLTPRGMIFDDEVQSLVATGSEGQFGVLSGHAPMIVATIPGLLTIKDEKERFFAAGTGLLEVAMDGHVKLLSDQVEECDSLDAAKAAAKDMRPG